MEEIGRRCFEGCRHITEIEIPDSVKYIGNGALYGTNISELILPSCLEEIGTIVNHDQFESEIEDEDHLKKIVNNSGIVIPLRMFSNTREQRRGYYWYLDEEGNKRVSEDGLPAGATAYRIKTRPDMDDYLSEYDKILLQIDKNGISIDDGNTIEEIYDYIVSILPTMESDDITVTVEISDRTTSGPGEFIPAKNGNADNPEGKLGHFGVIVTFENTESGEKEEIRYICNIIPHKYSGSSDQSNKKDKTSDSGNSVSKLTRSFSDPDNILTSRPNVNNGTWEKVDDSWKLKLNNNTYAYSQWAYIDGNWYYIDDTEKVATGWQKVNGKWYYLHTDGAMRTSWQNIDNEWFYFNDNGEMVTGQQNINGIDYYFDVDGKMINQ